MDYTLMARDSGCLLEISSPISIVSPAISDVVPPFPGLAPLLPTAIMSSSYPGVVLMDYDAKGDDELDLREGDRVKVYKKYCHWSVPSLISWKAY
jgi:hypothetical protein